jgi:hypothetical protein
MACTQCSLQTNAAALSNATSGAGGQKTQALLPISTEEKTQRITSILKRTGLQE